MQLSAALLSIAAVAFSVAPPRWLGRTLGSVCAVLMVAACIKTWGVTEGLLVALVLAMGAASLLVLVLPQRRSRALPLGVLSGVLGGVLLVVRGFG